MENKSYKPIIGYYTLLFIISSFIFSTYSFIKILTDTIFITSIEEIELIRKCNVNYTVNILTIASTLQYIFITSFTICDSFTYNVSKGLYRIFYTSYILFNIISCIVFLINSDCFKFFKDNAHYYYVSIIIQFSFCLVTIILELLEYCSCSNCSCNASDCTAYNECVECCNTPKKETTSLLDS